MYSDPTLPLAFGSGRSGVALRDVKGDKDGGVVGCTRTPAEGLSCWRPNHTSYKYCGGTYSVGESTANMESLIIGVSSRMQSYMT